MKGHRRKVLPLAPLTHQPDAIGASSLCSRDHKLTVRIKQLLSAQFAQTRQLSEAARPSFLSIRGLPLTTNARLL